MATWDSADLLARCKRLALRPTTDEETADADWYALLSEAQAHWQPVFAAHFPYYYWSAPTVMSTADSGATYTFSGSITPLRVEIYDAPNGVLLKPCTYWDASGDYVWESSKIRWPQNRTRTFTAGGPYARTITAPTVIDGSTAPTLLPDFARVLLVYRAVAEWANRGGLRDPRPFYEMEDRAWYNPANGTGILVQLKQQNPFQGAAAWGSADIAVTANLATLDGGYQSI